MQSLVILTAAVLAVNAAQAPSFAQPASSPEATSASYVGASNSTLSNGPNVPGKVFDRFVQIWLENTDFNDAATSKAFTELAQQGIALDQYYALTHPSEPNYVATVGGSFWGMHDDALYNIPSNISTIVDLLEAKNISWAEYQEDAPTDGYQGFNFTQPNYLNSSAPPYTYYVRKHNPLVVYDSVSANPARLARLRNFNDFAVDLNASALPQWSFITPNLVNDGHDTSIDFASDWVEFWLVPLLKDPNFNTNKTLILLTFDENETQSVNNRIVALLLGGAVPKASINTTDNTYYTHYSSMSTVQANWGLGSLGRGDTDGIMNNVYKLVANVTGFKNNKLSGDALPLTNITDTIPGPLNAQAYVPFTAPNITAVGAGGGQVFVTNTTNVNLTAASAPAPVNLTAANASAVVPAAGPLNTAISPSGGGGGTGAGIGLQVNLGMLLVGAAAVVGGLVLL